MGACLDRAAMPVPWSWTDAPAIAGAVCRELFLEGPVEVGLSPVTAQMGPGSARWSFFIGTAEPRWGFRAAAARG